MNICQLCNAEQGEIIFHVHHIDYNKKNCSPSNLITLCPGCHTKTTNYKREYFTKYFQDYMNKRIIGLNKWM